MWCSLEIIYMTSAIFNKKCFKGGIFSIGVIFLIIDVTFTYKETKNNFLSKHLFMQMSLLPLYGQVNLDISKIKRYAVNSKARFWVLACHIYQLSTLPLAMIGKTQHSLSSEVFRSFIDLPKLNFLKEAYSIPLFQFPRIQRFWRTKRPSHARM